MAQCPWPRGSAPPDLTLDAGALGPSRASPTAADAILEAPWIPTQKSPELRSSSRGPHLLKPSTRGVDLSSPARRARGAYLRTGCIFRSQDSSGVMSSPPNHR
ncbi:hypothetical protein R6Z07M_011932 [Ovis aries]